ncbi:MAG: TPM domain-containing protein, partial [Myxococcales bacterium]|nr:TPM domain-containing protein [Myxococcales bacterium]
MLSLALVVVLGVSSVADVQSPRPNGWVTDQAHVLDPASTRRLDELADRLHADRGIELAVVTVDSVPGTPKQFATALFNHWGIGSAQTHNGLLVLLVMGSRRLEIETGRGMEAALTSAWLAEMQAQAMVPRFKQRDFPGGLVAGLEAIDAQLRAAPGESTSTSAAGEYRSDGV